MARNKYPEVTVEKILDASLRLFLTKGYDNTTINDIVNELGGLTKGAIYHHFKSKEDIILALEDKLFWENNPFTVVNELKELNGLQKLQQVMLHNLIDPDRSELNRQFIPILKNPRILVQMIESSRKIVAPLMAELINEGNRDGSINTKYTKELSEVILMLSDLWLTPSIYPATADEIYKKLEFIKALTDGLGLPLFDDNIMSHCRQFLSKVITSDNFDTK